VDGPGKNPQSRRTPPAYRWPWLGKAGTQADETRSATAEEILWGSALLLWKTSPFAWETRCLSVENLAIE